MRRCGLSMVSMLALALATVSSGKEMLINVNFDVAERDEAALDGPFEGNAGSDLGTMWNQIVRGPGRTWTIDETDLKDSTGAATSAKFRVDKKGHTLGCWAWGTPDLALLTSAITGWDPDVDSYDLVLRGFTGGTKYDLYIASFHPNENGGRALFSTTNKTTTESPQIVDNGGGGGNNSTWVKGENYTLFEKVEPDANGEIIIHVYSDWTTDSTKRAYVSGFQLMSSAAPERAGSPNPEVEATDISRDVVLGWTAGQFATAHDVYFGTGRDDVSDATTDSATYRGRQAGTTFPPGRLDFDTTYYWRIDEVNAPADSTVFKGEVWSFTTEPIAYPLAGEHITATASSANEDTEGPSNVINGSGVDANGLHSTDLGDMWRTSVTDASPWIEFAFDKPYMLHEMLVWNHNLALEKTIGFGIKEATVEYSVDGVEWAPLGTVGLARATGRADYTANGKVAFGGATARYVRLMPVSNWGGILNHFGLSEVRFLHIPVRARGSHPLPGQGDVDVMTTLSWRAGRQAAAHDVYLGTDEQAVIDGTAPMATVDDPIYVPALDLASTYYWRVDEVNEVETPAIWQGDVWSFSTQEFIVVDDFESYTDDMDGGKAIFQTWSDGYEVPTNGSLVGYETSPFAERTIVHSGRQSMPLAYDNSSATYSETRRAFDAPQNWTLYGIARLTLWFRGNPENVPQPMYVKINNTKVAYDGDAANILEPRWMQWEIALNELANQGVNLSNITQLSIGFDRLGGAGGRGLAFFDDIQLHPQSEVSSISIVVPNGDFEEIYRPSSTTITADLGGGWTQGLGPDTPMDSGTATYSDGTAGQTVDIPGWIGADAQGWIDHGGSYGRDTTFANRQGSVARQRSTPDGLYYYLANGGGWGNPAGGLIVSDAPVATVESGLTYTLSMLAAGGAAPVVLELLADGVPLTPTSSADPQLRDDWQEFSRTYDAASLESRVGASLTIRLGLGRGASGGQTCFDAVSLSYAR